MTPNYINVKYALVRTGTESSARRSFESPEPSLIPKKSRYGGNIRITRTNCP